MYDIKQSTAITVPFFVHDASGDAVTGLVDAGFTKRISKNGAAFAAMTVTISEMENGWYSIPLSTAHSDTLGLLTVLFTHASAKQVNLQWRVQARLDDDLAYPTTTGRSIDVTTTGEVGLDLDNTVGTIAAAQIATDAITAAKIANGAIDAATFAAGAIDAAAIATGAIDADAIATDAIGSAELAATAVDEIVDAVWDEDIVAAHGAADVAGRALRTLDAISDRVNNSNLNSLLGVPDAVGHTIESGLDDIETDTQDIQGRLPAALVGGRMDSDVAVMQAATIGSATFAVGAIDAAALATDAGQEIADRILARNVAGGSDTGRVVSEALFYLRNRVAIAAGTMTVYQTNDSTSSWTAAVTTAAGDPITEIDPA